MNWKEWATFGWMATVACAPLCVVLAGMIGWVLNLVAIAQTCCTPFDGMMVLRIVGIFLAPIGAVVGYF